MADSDSDLEIIPNTKLTSNIVDLSTDNDTVQSVIDDMKHEQQKRQQFSKKRPIATIKGETTVNEPAVKRRKINNQSNSIPKQIKQEQKEIVIKQKTASVSNQTKSKCAKNSYHFHCVSPGINYSGKCLNRACIAYNQPVVMKRGFGIFEPSKDSMNKIINCCGCSHEFKLDTIYLYQCIATIQSKKLGETNVKRERVSVNGNDNLRYSYQVKEITRKVKVNRNKNNSNNSNSSGSRANSQNESQMLKFTVERYHCI